MAKRFVWLLLPLLCLAMVFCLPAQAAGIEAVVEKAVEQARQELGGLDKASEVACLTNAGYSAYKGESTLIALDVLAKVLPVSPGKGNLLVRPAKASDPLYFMFIKKAGPEKLMAVYALEKSGALKYGPALNIFIGKGTFFKPFNQAYGPMAFNLVTLANGWAMGLPHDIMRAALIHGHLCCGVFTGYFTTRFIEKKIPLQKGENYVYVGAPAWCQDDYIIDYMRLTPGTHGYVTMAFPWSKNWPTKEKDYTQLGGVVVRFNRKTNLGKAYVLKFDWRHEEFKKYMAMPDLKLDWRGQPWLHNAYDRFFMTRLEEPEMFVSIQKTSDINGVGDLNAIIGLGANPLAKILGPRVAD